MTVLCYAISGYLLICVARVILSFVPYDQSSIIGSIGNVAYTLTEPVFAPIRNAIPQAGDLPIDFSPAIVIIVLSLLRGFVC